MGLFSKLFGGAGSDKADKMRQAAIDAFTSIQTPELKDLQIQLEEYVVQGRLTPDQAEAELLKSNAFNDIITDPALEGAQKQALTALQKIGTEGGLTAIDRARMADITSEQSQVAKSRNEAILSQARERGMGGSDISTVSQLISEQGAADIAARRGTEVAAQAEARALQAIIAGGQTAGGIRAQSYGEQANRAVAENAIDLFNKQTLNQTNLYNIDAANKAQAANLAEQQRVADVNVGTSNVEQQYNAQRNQQIFENEMRKASGIAGTYNQWAGDATQAARSEQAADLALTGGAVQTGATALGGAFAGPVGAVAAKGAFTPSNPTEAGFQDEYDKNLAGTRFSHGGEVPGEAVIPGNSPVNDTVPAQLSPGEVVVPRTAMSDDEEFDVFMEKFRPSKRKPQVDPDTPLVEQALSSLHTRVDQLERR